MILRSFLIPFRNHQHQQISYCPQKHILAPQMQTYPHFLQKHTHDVTSKCIHTYRPNTTVKQKRSTTAAPSKRKGTYAQPPQTRANPTPKENGLGKGEALPHTHTHTHTHTHKQKKTHIHTNKKTNTHTHTHTPHTHTHTHTHHILCLRNKIARRSEGILHPQQNPPVCPACKDGWNPSPMADTNHQLNTDTQEGFAVEYRCMRGPLRLQQKQLVHTLAHPLHELPQKRHLRWATRFDGEKEVG